MKSLYRIRLFEESFCADFESISELKMLLDSKFTSTSSAYQAIGDYLILNSKSQVQLEIVELLCSDSVYSIFFKDVL
jgi:hypothetical protein